MFRRLLRAAAEWVNVTFRGGHIVLVHGEDVVYDGPRSSAPKAIVEEFDRELEKILRYHQLMERDMRAAIDKARAKKAREKRKQ